MEREEGKAAARTPRASGTSTFNEVQLMKVVFFSPFLVVANETAVEVLPDRCDADCFCPNTVESAQTPNDSLTNCFEHERLSKKQRSTDTIAPCAEPLGFPWGLCENSL